MKKIITWFLLTLFFSFFASDMRADTLYLGDCVLQNNDPVAPDSFWVKVRKNGVLDTTFTFDVSDSNEYGCYDSPYVFTGDGAVYTIWVGFVVSGDTIFTRTETYHSYSWIGDDLDSIYDTLLKIQDSTEAYDGWVASEANVNKALDSLGDVLDSIGSLYSLADSILDTLLKVQDSTEAYDGWVASEVNVNKALDSLGDILDSMRNYDNWIAQEASVSKTLNSLGVVIDSLETQSVWLQDSLFSVIDSIQDMYGWLAHQTTVDSVFDTLMIIQDSVESYDDWVATALGMDSLLINYISIAGDIVDTVANTSSFFKTNLSNAVNNHYNDLLLVFSTGTNAGQARIVGDYDGAKKVITVNTAFEAEPAAGDDFAIMFNAGTAATIDSLYALLDSIQDMYGWVAYQTTVDSVYAINDSILDTLLKMQDSIDAKISTAGSEAAVSQDDIDKICSLTADTLTLRGLFDSLGNLAKSADSIYAINDSILDTLLKIQDSTEAYDNWVARQSQVDSNYAISDSIYDTLLKIQDSLEAYDDWIAHQTTVDSNYAISDSILDTLLKIQDSIESYDNWIAHQTTVDSAYAISDSILDTLLKIQDSVEAYDNWMAHQTTIDSVFDTLMKIQDSIEAYDDWISSFDPTTTSVVAIDTLASGDTIARQKDSSSFQGDITTVWTEAEIDSIMEMTTRVGTYWGAICDTTLMIGYPIGYKPKDSLRIFCITNAMADTTYVGTIRSSIINKVRSITNVEDTILFIR